MIMIMNNYNYNNNRMGSGCTKPKDGRTIV